MNKEKEIKIKKADERKTNENYEDIESPNFIKFDNLGDEIEGMLIDKSISDRYGFGLYTMITKDGERKRFHGTQQLDDLMGGVNLQDYIIITYIDNQNLPQGQMKLFSVRRKKE